MKKAPFLLIISLTFLFLASAVFAQGTGGEKDFKFTIKTNPLSALGGPLYITIIPITAEYKVLFEARTFEKQSVQFGVGYLGSSPLVAAFGNLEGDTTVIASGIRGQVWYKFFLTDEKAPRGFYIGPHFSYASAKVMNNKVREKYFMASKLNVDVVFGYQVITKGGFALDIYTGLGLKVRSYDAVNFNLGDTFKDWELNNKTTIGVPFGFTFGYAF
jgi:hypothetical protein